MKIHQRRENSPGLTESNFWNDHRRWSGHPLDTPPGALIRLVNGVWEAKNVKSNDFKGYKMS